jgi:hypothetical protein
MDAKFVGSGSTEVWIDPSNRPDDQITVSNCGSERTSPRSRAARQCRSVIASIATGLLLSSLVSPASAVKPTIVRGELPPGTLFPLPAGTCSFNVTVEVLRSKLTIKTFSNQSGAVIAQSITSTTGQLAVSLTNESTGKSIDLNIPGPGRIESQAQPPEEIITGPWLIFSDPPGQFFLPSNLELLIGRWQFSVDSTGTMTAFLGGHGTMQDVCALLS